MHQARRNVFNDDASFVESTGIKLIIIARKCSNKISDVLYADLDAARSQGVWNKAMNEIDREILIHVRLEVMELEACPIEF